METLFVYADFEWLNNPELIGVLTYESIRGTDSYAFEFNREWLKKHKAIFLSADIQAYSGRKFSEIGKDIFGCFADALPDRWGRTLINRREQIEAQEENRSVRRLSSFDYLCGIDDASRMGALRFKQTPKSEFINSSSSLQIPPITNIKELINACHEIEISEEKNILPQKKWIHQLIQPGTSLGGARPKANVIDEFNHLNIAKFPSRNDDYDIALWEHWAHCMAKQVGINVAQTRVVSTEQKYHTLLSRRFDRTNDNRRIHFASAMTLLGLNDGANATTNNGYLDIVDFIIQHCCNVEQNLQELYRRVAFNICIGNSDDHFRNHGFLLTPKGWTLSPAYDMNPTLNNYQSLLISTNSNEANLDILLNASEEYMINKQKGKEIIDQVTSSLKNWQEVAIKLQIPNSSINMFSSRINEKIY